jgi:hypothetical protein
LSGTATYLIVRLFTASEWKKLNDEYGKRSGLTISKAASAFRRLYGQ